MPNKLVSSLMGAAVLASLALCQPANAAIVYSNNFEGAVSCSFTCALSGGTVLNAPNNSTHFLGNLGGNQGTGVSATLTLSGLAAHTSVTVGFTLDVVGSMDGTVNNGGGSGDYFTIGYNGSGGGMFFNQAFANYGNGNSQTYPTPGSAPASGASTINALGYTGFPDSGNGIQDSEYNFSSVGLGNFTFADTGSTLTITFTSFSNESLANEFYGIDNLVVQTQGRAGAPPVSGVPEPMPLLLMGIGLAACVVGKRRRHRSTTSVWRSRSSGVRISAPARPASFEERTTRVSSRQPACAASACQAPRIIATPCAPLASARPRSICIRPPIA